MLDFMPIKNILYIILMVFPYCLSMLCVELFFLHKYKKGSSFVTMDRTTIIVSSNLLWKCYLCLGIFIMSIVIIFINYHNNILFFLLLIFCGLFSGICYTYMKFNIRTFVITLFVVSFISTFFQNLSLFTMTLGVFPFLHTLILSYITGRHFIFEKL